MARELHKAGVATDALEQTLSAVAESIGLRAQIFALPTYVTLAVGPDYRQKTVMLRMGPGRVSLRKITLLNEIYDDLLRGKIDYVQAAKLLREMDRRWPGFGNWKYIPALMLVAIGVAVILGGGWRELIVAGAIGAVTGLFYALAERSAFIHRLREVLSAFVGTLVYALCTKLIGPANIYDSIVAGVVVLLPGYSMTLALHELANENLVAGVARLGRVFSVLLTLSCGALLGFAVLGPALLVNGDVLPHPVPALAWIGAVLLLSAGNFLELDARPGDFIWVFAASFVAILTSHVVGLLPVHQVASFAAAFICGVTANLGARFLRVPQPVMLVPAILVLVPGSLSYESALFAVSQVAPEHALQLAINAVANAVLLVAGLLLSQIVFPSAPLRNQPGSY